jgi:hypothetical protein
MRTRTGAVLAVALLLPLLAACSAPAPEPTETASPEPVSLEGNWVATRTLTSTTLTNEGLEVGVVETRLLEFDAFECDDDGVCTASYTSAISDSEEDQAKAGTGEATWDGEVLTLSIQNLADCTYTDGSVAFPEAFSYDTTYDLAVSDGDAQSVSAFTGTVSAQVSTSDEAIASGCPEAVGERLYDVEVVPA